MDPSTQRDTLAAYLDALGREDRYSVEAVLKESPVERTELVVLQNQTAISPQRFIRKIIRRDTGIGSAYERIFNTQQRGFTFHYLPAIYECYRTEDSLVVVMEYLQGETLQDAIYRLDPSIELAADVFPRICDAVTELHESFHTPIIHRDLKPSNIMISNTRLTLIDFGIAREFKQAAESDTQQFGTRAFAPPEQYGFGQTTVRSDVYALGMLLYYCLTEIIPDSRVREEGFFDSRIPPALRGVLLKATEFDPDHRFQSVRELKNAFLDALNNQTLRHQEVLLYSYSTPNNTGQKAANPPAASQSKRIFNKAINVTLIAICALFIAFSWYDFATIQDHLSSYGIIYDSLSYLIFVPALVLSLTLALLRKKDLAERFPIFARPQKHWWTLFIIVFAVYLLFAVIMVALNSP